MSMMKKSLRITAKKSAVALLVLSFVPFSLLFLWLPLLNIIMEVDMNHSVKMDKVKMDNAVKTSSVKTPTTA